MRVLLANRILCSSFCFALGSVLAFGQAAGPGNSDQQFVDFAAQTDMLEAHLGQMAVDQAAGANFKEFAQMLTTDHTNAYQQLSRIAGKAGLTVPKAIDEKGNKMIAPFEKLKGASFDTRFAREMVAGHQKAIDQYKKEVSDGQNADLKAYAAQALPTLERHLQAAKELRSSGKSAGKMSEKM